MGPIYCDIFEPAEWIRYIAIYFNLPSDCDIWPADKPLIYLQKSFISSMLPSRWIRCSVQGDPARQARRPGEQPACGRGRCRVDRRPGGQRCLDHTGDSQADFHGSISKCFLSLLFQANHGGGYQYRLCPKGQPLTEVFSTSSLTSSSISPDQKYPPFPIIPIQECFQKLPLPFTGLQGFHWGDGVKVGFICTSCWQSLVQNRDDVDL